MYLTFPGVTGPSTAAGHAGDIELRSFKFAMRSSTRPAGTISGQPVFDGVHITKLTDQTSGPLMRALTRGTRIPKLTISLREPGARADFQRFEMTDVVVTGFAQGGKAEPAALENIDLDFASFLSGVTPTRPDGTLGAEVTFGYDVVRQAER